MNWLNFVRAKIATSVAESTLIKDWKLEGQKIVFTNGCFDIVHRGHIDYLSRAASLGDKLVIGLNTDASIKRIKGDSRPIQDQESRAMLLAALCFVDAVIFFDEDTPYNLINELQPDVLVKGADYKKENIVGYDIVIQNGGSVQTLNFIEGYSTSHLIAKIKQDK